MNANSSEEKNSNTVLYIALAVFVITTVIFGLKYRECRKDSVYDPYRDELSKREIQLLQQERDSIKNLYELEIQRANKAASGISQSKSKQASNKKQYEKELSDWSALPDSALRERSNFFRRELSKVDSIAKR